MLNFFSQLSMNSFPASNQPQNFSADNGLAEIQMQKGVDQWRTVATVESNPGYISMSMMEYAQMYPDYRIRAVDQSGRLLDII